LDRVFKALELSASIGRRRSLLGSGRRAGRRIFGGSWIYVTVGYEHREHLGTGARIGHRVDFLSVELEVALHVHGRELWALRRGPMDQVFVEDGVE
jgi:hypothetical protein